MGTVVVVGALIGILVVLEICLVMGLVPVWRTWPSYCFRVVWLDKVG